MDDVLDASVSAERMMALLSVFFAGCALLVTGIGLFGTLAYATARRTSEIGIRMALGARRAAVIAMIFRENVAIMVVGSLAGLIAGVLTSRVLASFFLIRHLAPRSVGPRDLLFCAGCNRRRSYSIAGVASSAN